MTHLLTPDILEIIEQLKHLLVSQINPKLTLEQIDKNSSILEDDLNLDSIMVVEFIVLLEKNFGFTFSENELNMDAFASLETLAAFISEKNKQVA